MFIILTGIYTRLSFVVDNKLADIPKWNFTQSYKFKKWIGFMIYISEKAEKMEDLYVLTDSNT